MKKIILGALIITGMVIMMSAQTNGQIISTIAGSATQGWTGDNGPATNAGLYDVVGVAVDDTGNVYIADSHDGAIRKVEASTGVITTLAGNGTSNTYYGSGVAATSAILNDPQQVSLDDSGNIYFADYGNEVIRKITVKTGIITTIAGTPQDWSFSGDGGQATAATLSVVTGVAVDDSGNVYIADQWNMRIRKITKTTGIINTIAGTGTEGFNGNGIMATTAELAYPTEIALDDSGNVYFTDAFNNEVRKITKATGIINDFAGDQTVSTGLGSGGYSGDGGQATAAQLNYPNGLFRDKSGNVYIADWYNQVIREVAAGTGIITTIAGDGFGGPGANGGFSGDGGPALSAELNASEGLATDKCGNIYIGDMFNNRVRKVTITDSAVISITPNAPTICSGGSVLLVASGANTYKWSPAAGLSDTTGDSVFVNPTITTTYTITGIATVGCTGSGSTQVVVTVTGTALPLVILPHSPSVCNGQIITLSVDTSGSNYTWSPSLGLNNTTGDSVSANPSALTVYTVTGTDSLGCMVTGSDTVTLATALPLIINPQSPSVCYGSPTTLTADSTGSNYTWSPAAGLNTTTGFTTTLLNPTANVTYSVTGLDSLGCMVSASDTVKVIAAPNKPTITIHWDTLISSASSDNQWNYEGTPINNAIYQTLVVSGSTSGYSVTVTNEANGCTTTSDTTTTTGINQLSAISEQLSIYPNPFSNSIDVNINSSVINISEWSLQIFDVLGRDVYTNSSLNYRNIIDLPELPGGMYFITVMNKTTRAVFPVVKQN